MDESCEDILDVAPYPGDDMNVAVTEDLSACVCEPAADENGYTLFEKEVDALKDAAMSPQHLLALQNGSVVNGHEQNGLRTVQPRRDAVAKDRYGELLSHVHALVVAGGQEKTLWQQHSHCDN